MHLKKLRTLQLASAPQPGRSLHLSAASGLVRTASNFYVVADDELHLGAFPLDGTARGHLVRLLPGELPDATRPRKKVKPDFEALTLLEPFTSYPRGALLALASGSKQNRHRGVLVGIDKQGVNAATVRSIDASQLYRAIGKEIDVPNIEGAVAIGNRLLLMHRGNKSNAVNAIIGFDLTAILSSIARDDAIGKLPILTLERYDLGGVAGVPLCFTDGAALPDGRIVFSAVAENTLDSYCDGPCLAAAIGLIAASGKVQAVHYLDKPYKIEGIHAEVKGNRINLRLVTDADDASVPALLLSGELPA